MKTKHKRFIPHLEQVWVRGTNESDQAHFYLSSLRARARSFLDLKDVVEEV